MNREHIIKSELTTQTCISAALVVSGSFETIRSSGGIASLLIW